MGGLTNIDVRRSLVKFLLEGKLQMIREEWWMFESLQGLFNTLFGDITKTFITLFSIGILVCGLLAAFGGEENQPRFKKGLITCVTGLVAFLLAKQVVDYFQTNLGG